LSASARVVRQAARFSRLSGAVKAPHSPKVALFSTKVDSFLSGSSSVYVEQMYEAYLSDPKR